MTRKNILPYAAMEKLLKKAGAERVSDKSKEAFAEVLEELGLALGEKAVKFSRHSGRKTIKEEDIKLAHKS
ncbi:MAG: histone family protein [Nanoarchaeota archaeon]|nr:histone family protein [Nanoarchaeota archaeon]